MKLKNNITISTTIAIAVWAALASAAAPPNPTVSDAKSNTAGGSSVLINNKGANNTGFGSGALAANILGNDNTALGTHSLTNNSGHYNTAIGSGAQGVDTSLPLNYYNTAIGYHALFEPFGSYNTATGAKTLEALPIDGSKNTANGYAALQKSQWGSLNTALGFASLNNSFDGVNNTAVGANAGFSLIYGSNNIYLGSTGINYDESTMRLGGNKQARAFISGVRSITTDFSNAVPVVIDSKGQLGTINSSSRFKKDIQNMNETSNKLMQLRPVTYHYKQPDESGANPLEYGLIAEEVAKVCPDLVAYGADGKIETVQYQKLTPMLLNELQNMNEKLHDEQLKNQQQALEIASLKTKAQEVAELKQQVLALTTQASNIEAISARLTRIEAQQTVGLNR